MLGYQVIAIDEAQISQKTTHKYSETSGRIYHTSTQMQDQGAETIKKNENPKFLRNWWDNKFLPSLLLTHQILETNKGVFFPMCVWCMLKGKDKRETNCS